MRHSSPKQDSIRLREEFKNATITFHFPFRLRKTWSENQHDYCDAMVFEKLRPHVNAKLAFQIPRVQKHFWFGLE